MQYVEVCSRDYWCVRRPLSYSHWRITSCQQNKQLSLTSCAWHRMESGTQVQPRLRPGHAQTDPYGLSYETRYLQKAHLSQRDCATLHVVENFAKLLKIIRNYTVCKFISVFHCYYASILYRFWNIQRRIMACPVPEIWTTKMAPFHWSYTTYQSVIASIAISCTIFDIFDVEQYCDFKT